MRDHFAPLWVAAVLSAAVPALSADYDEAVLGDASNDPNLPTVLSLDLGSNIVAGSVFNSNNVASGDIDFFSFTLGPGRQLDALFLLDYSPADRGFHAINTGPMGIVPSGPNAGDVTGYLGSAHLDPVPSTTNLLLDLGTPLIGSGFTPPLPAGTYTYVIQQTSNLTSDYQLDFTVTPEPATVVLLLPALLTLRQRRRPNLP